MEDRSLNTKGGAAVSGISGFTLKMIAVVTMLIDHTAATILERAVYGYYPHNFVTPDNMQFWQNVYMAMRTIGRMAFPIYCYLLVEGFHYTRNRWKYALRLFLFALISEVPFDLAFNQTWWDMSYNNVFFTLLLGLLAVMGVDWIRNNMKVVDASKSWGHWFCANFSKCFAMTVVIVAVMTVAELVLHTDYGAGGIVAIVLIYLLYKNKEVAFGASVVSLGLISSGLEFAALLMLVPIRAYNGTRGKQMKYFFYVFYPAHLAILVGICYLIGFK